MGLFDKIKIRRAIESSTSPGETTGAEKSKAVALLRRLRPRAVPILIEELVAAPDSAPLKELLGSMLDDATLDGFRAALCVGDQRLCSTLIEMLSNDGQFDANRLLAWFQDAAVPKAALVTILGARRDGLSEQALAEFLISAPTENRATVFRFVESIATPALVPHLINQLECDDWRIRLSIARTLSRFSRPDSCKALTDLLSDPNKAVRMAALEGLGGLQLRPEVAPIAALLRDPDLTVQSKAIEIMCELNDPRSFQYLLDVLHDESEYVRRAAVEVLNEIGNASMIKDLLDALRDKDWWVRVRAADALGSIGGPKVIQATLSLLREKDEFIRRCAIEILNTTRDEQAFDSLVEALGDEDWWVRERAVDALGALGDKRAVPALVGLLGTHPEAASVVIGALSSLGDAGAVVPLLEHLQGDDDAVVSKVLAVLPELTSHDQVDEVCRAIRALIAVAPETLRELAAETLNSVTMKFGDRSVAHLDPGPRKRDSGQPPRSLIAPNASATVLQGISQRDEPADGSKSQDRIIDATALEAGEILGDRYRVIRHLRGGACGVVVLVEDEVLSEEVILKFLRPHLAIDDKVIKRFMQELRCARKISHENVIRIHDFLSLGRSYAISMEYFDSEPLSTEIQRVTRMGPERALQILADTCDGMIIAHAADVVHRDLKPGNILVNKSDQVKIVDFGLAAAASFAGTRLTATGMAVGTPTYMSPEQIRGKEFDARADIYSLGVILYEMLTGRPPYVGDDAISILYKHLEGQVTRPRELVDSIPGAVEDIVLKAMATEPDDRYQTCSELRDVLVEYLAKGAA